MNDIVKLEALEKRADHFAAASLSQATKRAYESDWTQFFQWCRAHELEELPASPETVVLYITDMADQGASIATIVRRLTSISAIHRAAGHDSPSKSDSVSRVLKGIKRICGAPPDQAKALSWSELMHMVSNCDSTMIGRRDAAILLLGWCSALRRSELVALNICDLEFSEQGLLVTVQRSKTDQTGKGAKIAIPRAMTGPCPVKSIKAWVDRLGKISTEDWDKSPLFRKIGVHGRGKWWYTPGKRLAARMVSEIVKRYAAFIGDPAKYSAHSLRRGFATEAGARGIPERIISRHTRHQSIAVLRQYIDDGEIWTENPLPAIYGTSSAPFPRSE